MKETIKLILKEDLSKQIHKIKKPTMIIWGDKDEATPIEDAYFINKEIKNSRLEIIMDTGHAINLDRPDELAEAIYKFLKSD